MWTIVHMSWFMAGPIGIWQLGKIALTYLGEPTMEFKEKKPSDAFPLEEIPFGFRKGLILLLEAFDCAQGLGRPPWSFAVDIQALKTAGLTDSGFRWLVYKGYVRHGTSDQLAKPDIRSPNVEERITFTAKTCFVLTETGVSHARQICLDEAGRSPLLVDKQLGTEDAHKQLGKPHWDPIRRELWLGKQLVKKFKQPAPCQETILAAFEEEYWPPHIDDPLPPMHGQVQEQRLHYTINNLNRSQKPPFIFFRGDGTGRGICWE